MWSLHSLVKTYLMMTISILTYCLIQFASMFVYYCRICVHEYIYLNFHLLDLCEVSYYFFSYVL